MNTYHPNQAYAHDLDIRFPGEHVPSWARPLVDGRQPNSAAWLVVMGRRSGKSWLARAAAGARAEGTARLVDLRAGEALVRRQGLGCLIGRRSAPQLPHGTVLFVDEPALCPDRGSGPGVDPAVLASGLQQVREAGAIPVVLATPGEHELLAPHLGVDHPKDVLRPPRLAPEECDRMAGREPAWAPGVVELLRVHCPGWLQTPFLLELALHTAESEPALREDVAALDRAAYETAVHQHAYIDQWFHNGLSRQGRARLRADRWLRSGVPVGEAETAGAAGAAGQQRAGAAVPAADPVLARHLPEVLRIHHVSDLHHGGSLRSNVDAKDPTEAGLRLAGLTGAGTSMDQYLKHLRRLGEQGRAPHLLVVTGDLVNRPHPSFGRLALNWLRSAAKALADHPDLRPADPRVLLVGGNHDVSWDLALDPRPEARHEWFAQTFAEFPHPDLQESRYDRRRLYVRYPEAGLRIALLGSAESGGEAARDEDRRKLEAAQAEFAATDDEDRFGALVLDFERVDPGVVSRGVLDRLGPEPGYTTLAALHHPLSPVPAVEIAPYAGVVNAGQAKRALAAAETSLVLHGHTHLGFLAAERFLGMPQEWTTRHAGAPALGSGETDEPNGYNEVFVAREGDAHVLAVRTVRLVGGEWAPSPAIAFRPGAPAELAEGLLCLDRED
ncbi:metallophosphoesterase [Streptomyces sp. KL116D]|uniref:metallophosphoesterase family protein n=1 Tax=Streptomyces sp. KL116D TaxID=3045152 RepID=UPI00355610D9